MKTKLVYVLTCAPDATYIEQALMAIWSARHWNPNATILLLTDDMTSAILHAAGPRSEILKYIDEEIVTQFERDESMLYRSRWIKTKARDLVSGNMLFIDCDTICCQSLCAIDNFNIEIGAVRDSNVYFYDDVSRDVTIKDALVIDCNISDEEIYYSSGVIYMKDSVIVHDLCEKWHENWLHGVSKGLNIDQPSFAKANIEMGHIIQPLPDKYNNVLYTQNSTLRESIILHVPSYKNTCVLFMKDSLLDIKDQGLLNKTKTALCNPHATYLPFEYEILHSSFIDRLHMIKIVAHLLDGYLSAIYWMIRKRIHVIHHKEKIKENVCKK